MFKYNGYIIDQSTKAPFYDVVVYRNGKFILHASMNEVLEEEELKVAVDQMLELSRNFQKKQSVK